MTTTTTETPPAFPAYPQTKLRIAATYHPGAVGEVQPAGQPESVEIELNELPDTDLHEFIAALVASLFRLAPDGTWPAVEYDTTGAVDQDRAEVPA